MLPDPPGPGARGVRRAPALLIGSDSFASEACDRHGVDPAQFTVVPGATDTERFTPVGEPGSIHEPARLLDHGRVDARKGVLDLLAAVRLLLDTGRRVRLAVSGIGPDSARLAEQVRADGLADLLGYIPYQDAHRVYGYGDVFVSPTYAEGFSNTILEAMASGLPVVSTDVVGALLDDAPRRRRLAGAALAEVRKRWSWPVIADQITDVYDRVLHHPAPIPTLPAPPVDLGCRFRSAPHLL